MGLRLIAPHTTITDTLVNEERGGAPVKSALFDDQGPIAEEAIIETRALLGRLHLQH